MLSVPPVTYILQTRRQEPGDSVTMRRLFHPLVHFSVVETGPETGKQWSLGLRQGDKDECQTYLDFEGS